MAITLVWMYRNQVHTLLLNKNLPICLSVLYWNNKLVRLKEFQITFLFTKRANLYRKSNVFIVRKSFVFLTVNNNLDENIFFFSAEVLDEQNRIYTKEDDRFLGLKLRACVTTKKIEEKVDKTIETPIEFEKIEKSNESENIDSENTEEDDEEKAKTIEKIENVENIEKVENVENVENVEKVENVETVEKIEKVENVENVEKAENVDDVKSKKVEVEEKFEKEESKKSELKSDGDEEVHDEADDIMNKIKEWYQEGKPF